MSLGSSHQHGFPICQNALNLYLEVYFLHFHQMDLSGKMSPGKQIFFYNTAWSLYKLENNS